MATAALIRGAPRYLVAKYIADIWRQEPVNVGVIVLWPGSAKARFVGETLPGSANVDGRSLWRWVGSISAYRQWIQFWHRTMDAVEDLPVAEAAERLVATSKGNFQLVDGGAFLEAPRGVTPAEIVDLLYLQLVAPPEKITPAAAHRPPEIDQLVLDLDTECDRLIAQTVLLSDPRFLNNYRVTCKVRGDIEEELEFSHAYQNHRLARLYQRVHLGRGESLRKNVHDTAWMFERVQENRLIARDECVSLVLMPMHSIASMRAARVLESVSRVINVADHDVALTEFSSVARGHG